MPAGDLPLEDARASSAPGGTSMPPLRRLAALLQPDRADMRTVVVFAVATGVLLLATPVAVQAVVNFVAFGGAIPPLVVVALLLFLCLGFAAALTATQTWIVEILQRRLFVRMVADLAARLPRVSLASRGHGYGPELVNRFFDVVTIQKVGSALLLDGMSALLTVLVGLVILAFYHPLLLAFDVLLLVVIGFLLVAPARRGVATAVKESKAKYAVAAWLEEVARNPVTFKAHGSQGWAQEQSDRLALDYVVQRRAHYRVVFNQVLGALLLQAVASTTLLAIGGLLVINGSLTLGQLVAAELIVTMVVGSFAKMGKHLEGFYDLMAAVDKVGQLLDLPLDAEQGERPHEHGTRPAGPARLALDRVQPRAGGPVEGLTFELEPGQRLAVTGPSGSGKSDLLRLLWGLHRAGAGSVFLDGRDLADLAPDFLRREVSLTAHLEIVTGSLAQNVSLGRPHVNDDDVRAALSAVGLGALTARLPDGLRTDVLPDGYPLTDGEIQALLVARAIVDRPRLLLFDGDLGALGERDRARVLDVLLAPDAPWTLIITSTTPEILARCDRALHLPAGQLTGTEGLTP